MNRSGCLRWLTLVLSQVAPSGARADEIGTPFQLVWEAPPECPQRAEVSSQILELLGRGEADLPEFAVHGTVTSAPKGGYALVLETVRGEHRGARTMSDESCRELTAAGAAVIALAIDPEFERRVANTSAAVEPRPAPAPEPPKAAPEPPKPPRPKAQQPRAQPVRIREAEGSLATSRSSTPGEPLEGWIDAGMVADLGTLPGVGFGPAISLLGRYGWALASVTGLWLPARRAAALGVSGQFEYWGASLDACASPWTSRWTLAGCGGVGLGRLSGQSVGASNDGAGGLTWTTAQLGALFRYRLGQDFTVSADAKLVLPLQTAEFTVEGWGPVHQPATVASRVVASLGWRFW